MPMAPLRVFLQKAVLRRLPEYTLLQVPRSLSISGWPRSDWDTTEQAIAESSWFKNEAKTSTAPEEFCSTNSQCLKWYDHRPLEGRRMRSGPTQEYSALVQHWAVPMEAVNGSCHRTKVSQRSSTYLEEQTASLKQPIAGGAWQHPGHPGQKVALGLGSASIFDGRGGRALSCQSFSASSSLTFGGDGRRFHSTPPHSSWFWPSNGGERLPPSSSDAPLLQESDQTQSDGTFPEPDSNLTEHLPDTAKVSLEALREGALESAPTAAGWGVWKALAPISGAIVVALDGVHSITGLPW